MATFTIHIDDDQVDDAVGVAKDIAHQVGELYGDDKVVVYTLGGDVVA